MTFKNKLDKEMILAAKATDKIRLSALRLLKNGLHNREIDLKRELNEAEFLQLLSGMVKQRRDSIEQFEKGGRSDLVEKEEAELKVIREFMPAEMSETELDAIIAEAIRETGAAGVRDIEVLLVRGVDGNDVKEMTGLLQGAHDVALGTIEDLHDLAGPAPGGRVGIPVEKPHHHPVARKRGREVMFGDEHVGLAVAGGDKAVPRSGQRQGSRNQISRLAQGIAVAPDAHNLAGDDHLVQELLELLLDLSLESQQGRDLRRRKRVLLLAQQLNNLRPDFVDIHSNACPP